MSAWEYVTGFQNSPAGRFLGVAGDTEMGVKIGYWCLTAAITVAKASVRRYRSNAEENSTRTQTCGLCDLPGHNRRTCDFNVECGNCGSTESDEIWELEGNYCCNLCLDDLDI